MKTIAEPARKTPVARDVDVVVVGGGPAGLAAAIASVRTGASTVLVEKFAFLGGTATASLMACVNGFRNQVEPDGTQIVKGIAEEIVLELIKLKGTGKSPYPQKAYPSTPGQMEYSYVIDTEKFKYLTLKMCVDAGVDIMFHTSFCDVIVDKENIQAVIVENKSGRQALCGKVIIDASGDGDVFARAGEDFWQIKKDEAKRLGDALMYRIEFGAKRPKEWFACDLGTNAVVWGPTPGEYMNGADGDELSRGEIRARLEIYSDLAGKKSQFPELADARIVESAALLGIRQTRFLKGEYTLTAEDAIEGRRFDDVIAISACAIIEYYGYRRYLEHEGYDIPYRCLLPKRIDNLLVAGRCISSRQEPYESHRAMIPIMAIGQAAGTAAALSAKGGVAPRKLGVGDLQEELLAQNVELRKSQSPA